MCGSRRHPNPDLGHFNLNSLTLNAPEVTLALYLEDEGCVHVRLEAGGHLDDLAVLRPQRLPHGGQQVDVGRAAGAWFSRSYVLACDFIDCRLIVMGINEVLMHFLSKTCNIAPEGA